MDTNGVAQSIDQYVWGPGSADAPLVCLHDGNADGDPTTTTTIPTGAATT